MFLGFPRGCNAGERVWAGSDSAQTHVSCLQLVSWLPNRQQLTPPPHPRALLSRSELKLPSNAEPQSENL